MPRELTVKCEKCYEWFHDNFNLNKHLNKRVPCDASNIHIVILILPDHAD